MKYYARPSANSHSFYSKRVVWSVYRTNVRFGEVIDTTPTLCYDGVSLTHLLGNETSLDLPSLMTASRGSNRYEVANEKTFRVRQAS